MPANIRHYLLVNAAKGLLLSTLPAVPPCVNAKPFKSASLNDTFGLRDLHDKHYAIIQVPGNLIYC